MRPGLVARTTESPATVVSDVERASSAPGALARHESERRSGSTSAAVGLADTGAVPYDPTIYLGAAAHYRCGRPAYSPELEAFLTREVGLDGTGRLRGSQERFSSAASTFGTPMRRVSAWLLSVATAEGMTMGAEQDK